MKHFSSRLVEFLAGTILLCATAFGQNGGLRFSLTDLGTFGGTWGEAWAINDQGTVVGTYGFGTGCGGYGYCHDNPGETQHGSRCFVWQSGGNLFTFDGGTKISRCKALAIDKKFNVAGWMYTQASPSAPRAFNVDAGWKLTIFDPPPGYNISMALAVSGGTVVGGIGNTSYGGGCDYCRFWFSGLQTAVKWDSAGHLTTIATGHNDYGNYARGINRSGEIVGRTYYYHPGNDAPSPWLWKNGVFTDLPMATAPGWEYGQAYAINDRGTIVGGGSVEDGTHNGICVQQWNSQSPASQPIVSHCGGTYIAGMAISNDNWVVGYSDFDFRLNPSSPFLVVADPNCAVADLNTLLDASGAGWSVATANGINNLHQVVGAGVSPVDGLWHAVLLKPNGLPLC